MKQIATLVLLLCASVCRGQCVPTTWYENCAASPFRTQGIWPLDTYPLPDQAVGEWSGIKEPPVPMWMTTDRANKRPFQLDSFELDPADAPNVNIVVVPYCGWPQIPPQPNNLNCRFDLYWNPRHRGLTTARYHYNGHFLDGKQESISHTVLLMGIGLPARHR